MAMITREAHRCWIASMEDDYDGSVPHWPTRAGARKGLLARFADLPATASEAAEPCFTVTCDGVCGEVLEDEECGGLHFGSRAEASRCLDVFGWIEFRDGRTFCPDDAPVHDGSGIVVPVPHDQPTLFSGAGC